MVYKKYIKRNGKVFGPYYYESYRENGKVKTRFISKPTRKDKIVREISPKIDSILVKKTYLLLFILFVIVINLLLLIFIPMQINNISKSSNLDLIKRVYFGIITLFLLATFLLVLLISKIIKNHRLLSKKLIEMENKLVLEKEKRFGKKAKKKIKRKKVKRKNKGRKKKAGKKKSLKKI
jgi:hypothetical protein